MVVIRKETVTSCSHDKTGELQMKTPSLVSAADSTSADEDEAEEKQSVVSSLDDCEEEKEGDAGQTAKGPLLRDGKKTISDSSSSSNVHHRITAIEHRIRDILPILSEDPTREGLLNTPRRYARTLLEMTSGYSQNLQSVVGGAVFKEECDELVVAKDMALFSVCEHHLLPFYGKIHIGYIPDGRLLGLSKFARISEMFSKRLQVQERLTQQIANAITEVLEPRGVAVLIEAEHLCMMMRGVNKPGSTTVTTALRGCFKEDVELWRRFMVMIQR